ARDARTAYQLISMTDRSSRDEKTYLRSVESFGGFALDLAKKFADEMELWVVSEKLGATKARYEIGYRAPVSDGIAPQIFDWNPDKLNALPPREQGRLLDAVEGVKKGGKRVTIEGRETFDLVREKGAWKIFLDWRSRSRIVFKARVPQSGDLEVGFFLNDFLVKIDDPFQIDFTVRNRTDRDLVVKLDHRFEPRELANSVDMIACGSLAPLRLGRRAMRSISSHYLLRGPVPQRSPLSIIYQFGAETAVVERRKVL
ncbi:MAG: hypothetical protein ACREPG_13500, partial [Candidatus Binatia bacterium]